MNIKDALSIHASSTVLFEQQEIDNGIKSLAGIMQPLIEDKFPLVLCVMNGGLYFTGQLVRHWQFPLTLDYVHATRYRLSTLGSDVVWKAYPQNEIKDRHIVVVDDIFDQGYTLQDIKNYCIKQGAKSVTNCFLIRKSHTRKKADIEADYAALECGDLYIYGNGMDYKGHFRNLIDIYAVDDEHNPHS
ncbi:MAG: hypoxanthine-guanine phosphoribosyltransferase [Gammaproteobacteria bacterium]|nr:hypoxanthine-guanine phosphoribosyltransferase [Gammaproteobacteria bacterium]